MKNIPALFINEEKRRRLAKEEVRKAIDSIKRYGTLAGVSDRTIYEFKALTVFMEKEIKREVRCEGKMGGGADERSIPANHGAAIQTE